MQNSPEQLQQKLHSIHVRCFEKPWTLTQFEPYSGENVIFAGESGFLLYETNPDECEIMTLCILPEERRKGLARKLCAELLETCRSRNLKTIFLEVDEQNLAAVKLYESLGFTQYRIRKGYYANGNNAVLMRYAL